MILNEVLPIKIVVTSNTRKLNWDRGYWLWMTTDVFWLLYMLDFASFSLKFIPLYSFLTLGNTSQFIGPFPIIYI